jgi:predicted TIM-barrel enzyme
MASTQAVSWWVYALGAAVVPASAVPVLTFFRVYPFARRAHMEQVHYGFQEHEVLSLTPTMDGARDPYNDQWDHHQRNVRALYVFTKRVATFTSDGVIASGESWGRTLSRSKVVEFREWPTTLHYLADQLFDGKGSRASLYMTAKYEDGKIVTEIIKDDSGIMAKVVEKHMPID